MRSTYRVLAYLVAAGVLVQAAAVAYAWFTVIQNIDEGGIFDKNAANAGHYTHAIAGMAVIPLVALLLLLVSFGARIPGGVKWAVATFGLTALQVAFAFAGFSAPVVGTLHGLNALALFAVALVAAYRVTGAVAAGEQQRVAAPGAIR